MALSRKKTDDFSFKPFKDLKKIIDMKGIKLIDKQYMSTDDPAADNELFEIAMKDVKENKEFRTLQVSHRKPLIITKKNDPNKEVLSTLLAITEGTLKIELSMTQEYVEWLNPRYAKRYLKDLPKRLHEKRFSVQDFLDLHGMTTAEAEEAVDIFINNALKQSLRCVKFIHGRGLRSNSGQAVLKEALIKWLQGKYSKHVIAFATAQCNDGGLGALYVLLRKRPSK